MTEIIPAVQAMMEKDFASGIKEAHSNSMPVQKKTALDNELQLVEQAQQGDHQAFAILLHHYDRRVMNVILRFTGNQFDKDDLYQDIFTACYVALPRFTGKSSFFTWLYRIALNYCVSYKRKKIPITVTTEVTALPQQSCEQQEQITAIYHAVNKLEGPQQITFHLFYIEQWSVAEIARVLECSAGTVKSNLDRARKKIRLDDEVMKWKS